jgi:iron-sulfur cluster assembly protein
MLGTKKTVMSMVTLQTETPKGAVAAPTVAAAPPSPVLTADGLSPDAKSIQVTVRALKRIRVAMAKEGIAPDAGGLRLGITGGGCSGLSYNIRFDTQPRERDRVYAFPQTHLDPTAPSQKRTVNIEASSEPQTHAQPREASAPTASNAPAASTPAIRIFVDPKSFIYLSGMILDYEETLMRQGFNFINPHSTKSCGCGSSFST